MHAFTLLVGIAGFLALTVIGDCECGYTSTVDNSTFTFSDVIESDFLHIRDVSLDPDWRRQNFSVTAEAGRGTFSKIIFQMSCLLSIYLLSKAACDNI